MQLFSWLVTFVIALFIALVLVLTFTQPEFNTTVGAKILVYKTHQLPVYVYVAAAFVAGLALGVMQVIFTFIRAKAALFHKNRRIRELEQKLEELERQTPPAETTPGERVEAPETSADAEPTI
jgi:uncharacterized membrane protein YciS (DUF1049 family)